MLEFKKVFLSSLERFPKLSSSKGVCLGAENGGEVGKDGVRSLFNRDIGLCSFVYFIAMGGKEEKGNYE